MKAVTYSEYGNSDVLSLRDVELPVAKDGEVLVKLVAASLNASDIEFLTGSPLYTRMWGLFSPRANILGSDIAGRVEGVGKGVSGFAVGDAVFGDLFERWGGLAEYVSAPAEKLLPKPIGLSYAEAACVPQAAVVALQGLRDRGKLQPGERVLINGAGGGSGSFAIQLAKFQGAEVVAVDSHEKLDLMRDLGADVVVDYAHADYTKSRRPYDLILDYVASKSVFANKRLLKEAGRYVMVGGSVRRFWSTLLVGPAITFGTKRKMGMLFHKQNRKDMEFILKLIHEEKLKVIIDRSFPLAESANAMRYLAEGHARGKVVVTMGD